MSEQPLVSVVIPSYNAAQYLPETLRSVLGQTYRNLEVIVVDDGSTDSTGTVIQEFVADSRVRYFQQPNGGAASARNRGVLESRGELVAFLDSDDLWQPEKLEKQVPLFRDPAVGIVYSDREHINEHGERIPCNPLVPYRGTCLAGQLLIRNFVPMSSAVMRRDVFDKAGPFDTTLSRSEDLDFWLRAALHYGFDFVHEPLVLHRKWAAQLTSNKAKVWESNLRIQDRFLREHPGVVKPQDRRRGWAIRYTGRGRVYVNEGRRLAAIGEFLRALCNDPGYQPAFRELAKVFLPRR